MLNAFTLLTVLTEPVNDESHWPQFSRVFLKICFGYTQ